MPGGPAHSPRAPPTTGPVDPRVPGDLSTRPGDGALSRIDAVKDERIRRWDVVTPSATLIGRPDHPDEDVGDTVRRLHDEAHPAMAGHSARMHRLEKARITHAFCNTLSLSPWERDRALGIMSELDLTAFGSQRAVETVALVVCKYVVDHERRRHLGLHDRSWLNQQSPAAMSLLYDRYESLTDDPAYQELLAAHDLDTTAVNRLIRTLEEQLDEQDLHCAVFGRSPHRDPALPNVREQSGSAALPAGDDGEHDG
jgi:hypothetical protein